MRVVLAPGASGSHRTILPYVRALSRGPGDVRVVDLPRRGALPIRAEDAVPAFLAQSGPDDNVVVGGHSYGGRVASLAAAGLRFAGLLLLSYPLHPRRRPDLPPRVAHWPKITCPVLVLSGDRDEYARVDLLLESTRLLARAKVVIYPGEGHGLGRATGAAAREAAAFVAALS